MYFGVSGKATMLYNNVGLMHFLRCRRRSVRKTWKSTFSITPLSFDASSPRNPHECLHKPYIARNYSHCATSLPPIVWVNLHSNIRGGLRKPMYFETECEMAVQGYPRALILVPIESAYATSYWSSIVTLVLICPVSEILQFAGFRYSEQRPHPYSTRILGVFPLN